MDRTVVRCVRSTGYGSLYSAGVVGGVILHVQKKYFYKSIAPLKPTIQGVNSMRCISNMSRKYSYIV